MSAALTTEAAALLDAARSSAQRLRHRTVDVEHLLAELARAGEGRKHLLARRVNPYVLGAALEDTLATKPPCDRRDGYRSVALPGMSPDVETALARATRTSGWLSRRSAGPMEVLEALLELPAARTLVEGCEVDAGPIERLHRAARDASRRLGHGNVLVSHALHAVFDDPGIAPELAHAFFVAGGKPLEMRRQVERLLLALRPCSELEPLGELVRQSMVHGIATHATTGRLSTIPVAVRWLRLEPVQAHVAAMGLDAYEVLVALAHGSRPAEGGDDEGIGAGPRTVVLHDDDHTTMEFVVEVLRECFDLDEESAKQAMLRVHEGGMAAVASFPAEVARERVAQARQAARDKWMPLRITTRPRHPADPPAT